MILFIGIACVIFAVVLNGVAVVALCADRMSPVRTVAGLVAFIGSYGLVYLSLPCFSGFPGGEVAGRWHYGASAESVQPAMRGGVIARQHRELARQEGRRATGQES